MTLRNSMLKGSAAAGPGMTHGRSSLLSSTALTAPAVVATAILALAPVAVQAQSWTGASSTSWTASGNWTGGVPANGGAVTIANCPSNQPTITTTVPPRPRQERWDR